jgi:drug/metabolite transporter (DMT)-like permease
VQTPNYAALVAFLGIVIIGGSNFVAVRFSNFELPPFWGATIRFITAAILFFVIIGVKHLSLPRGRALVGAVLYGALGFGAFYGFVYYALVGVGAGLASVILALVPLTTLFLAYFHRQESMGLKGVSGGIISIVGTALIFNEQLTLAIPLTSLLGLLGATFAIAEGSIVLKHFPRANPYSTNAVGLITGSFILLALSGVTGEAWIIPSKLNTWMALTYLASLGSVPLVVLYLYVLSRWTASATNYSFVLIPLVTVMVAMWLAGETVTLIFIAGSTLVLMGVYIGALFETRQRK